VQRLAYSGQGKQIKNQNVKIKMTYQNTKITKATDGTKDKRA